MAKGKYARKRLLKELRSIPIQNLELSTHTVNSLLSAGITTATDIVLRSESELKAIHGIGEKAMLEIKKSRDQFLSKNK